MKGLTLRIFGGVLWAVASLCMLDASVNAADDSDYRIRVGDQLSISVWKNPELSTTLIVRPDGKISFPLVDDIEAAGRTAKELKKDLASGLGKFIGNPDVAVIVVQIRNIELYVLGEIARPGRYEFRESVSLLHLLALAGGTTERADLNNAFVLRANEKLDVDFKALLESGKMSENIAVEDYDLVYVPRLEEEYVTVLGEINKPSAIPYRTGLRLADTLVMAGGVNEYADLARVKVIRGDKKIIANIDRIIKGGDAVDNIRMEPGDIVVVGESLF